MAFTQAFSFIDFPAVAGALQAFAEFLLQTCSAPKSVLNALGSVRHFHLDHGLHTGAFDSRQLQLWRRALPHTCRHVPAQAPPLPFQLLERLCGLSLRLGEAGVVFAALMAIAFASLARLSSLLPAAAGKFDTTRLPTVADLVWREGGWQLRLKWGKAHQDAAMAYWVPLLPVEGSPACPVARLISLRKARGHGKAQEPLFWSVESKTLIGLQRTPLTMKVAREWLRIMLTRLGRDSERFTFHSFRRGACTRAFLNGAQEQDLRRLGGWRSDAVSAYLPLEASRHRAAQAIGRVPQSYKTN